MKRGTVVRLIDGTLGIVLMEYKDTTRVLCEDCNVYPVATWTLVDTGKYFDLSIIWDTIKE